MYKSVRLFPDILEHLHSEAMSEQYTEECNIELRAQFHSLIALAFVPKEDVIKAFEDLEATIIDELISVFDYGEDNYMK